MQPETLKLLADVRQAGDAIVRYAGDITPGRYESDILLRSLVERQTEIIGEALRRLERTDPGVFAKIRHARRIIDFRNVIVHGYDSVDSTIVSQVVRQHLPILLEDIEAASKTP
ncbi:MAG TPA: HepT-like ribonuclease domain-containing protein [Phycisphaerae bacterium]|nr:HepT-like ribonuclease domain-containing protein [Phycisphaerae bacterium]